MCCWDRSAEAAYCHAIAVCRVQMVTAFAVDILLARSVVLRSFGDNFDVSDLCPDFENIGIILVVFVIAFGQNLRGAAFFTVAPILVTRHSYIFRTSLV